MPKLLKILLLEDKRKRIFLMVRGSIAGGKIIFIIL